MTSKWESCLGLARLPTAGSSGTGAMVLALLGTASWLVVYAHVFKRLLGKDIEMRSFDIQYMSFVLILSRPGAEGVWT